MNMEHWVAEVVEYFSVFQPPPSVALDAWDPSLILIEGGGLSIGVREVTTQTLGKSVRAPRFFVYDNEGEELGPWPAGSPQLARAVETAMKFYATVLFRRVNDRIATRHQAEEYQAGVATDWPL
jgi:hypothetical protein